jgi:teichuronic acid biosynthesis glycosyltransferase TuaC
VARILVLSKRQYMNKDIIDDRFGRFREIPLALARNGHVVRGLCLSYARRAEGWIADGPVRWRSINAGRWKIVGLLKFMVESLKQARKSDVIWACSDSFYGVIGCWAGGLRGVPVIFDIYDNFGAFLVARLPIAKQLYHWAIRRSAAVTCLSEAFAGYLQERFHRSVRTFPIEFAVRTELFHPMDKRACRRDLNLPEDALLVGTAGLLSPARDVHLLVEAFERLKFRYPNLHLALAGPLTADFTLPVEPRLHYLGQLPFETVPLFNNALDVAVVCYADDAFGRYCFPQKTREFMACDRPVIAAGVGSLKSLFKDHPQWLYAPGSAASLADVLERRLADSTTGYPPPPTWTDLTAKIEAVITELRTANAPRR